MAWVNFIARGPENWAVLKTLESKSHSVSLDLEQTTAVKSQVLEMS